MEFEPVIGLEIHAQLLTDAKIFCGCSTKFGAAPNTHTCPVCLGMPGVLPVLNRKVVEFMIRMALATNCRINPECNFARKNYFYPDLPKGYQISQYAAPPAEHGWVDVEINGGKKRIGITRIHMEEDAGKLMHDERNPVSLVDLNRTGVPLIEIVSEPDIRSAEEAAAYLRRLHETLVYLGICDGNMEEGSFRCDANVSLRPKGDGSLRDAGGAQEHELLPERPAGPRIRDQAPAVRSGGRRRGGPGDAPLGRHGGRDPIHAGQGGGARLPLLPRSGPRPRRDRRRLDRGDPEEPARAARWRSGSGSSGITGFPPTMRGFSPQAGRWPTTTKRWSSSPGSRRSRPTGSWATSCGF